jgi:glycosyltransferase involved in cell wall biosynthesis
VLSTCAPNEPRKRLTDLIDAWPRVRAAVPDARLRLAGDASPDLVDALLSRIPEPDRGSIRFLGSLDTADLAGEYSSAWVSVMPAVLEALGLSTLESLACGTPVVGADSGTTAALLADPAAGRLFRPAEPDDLARAVIEQLAATDRVDRDRCRGVTDAYDWERITDRVEAAYLALAG